MNNDKKGQLACKTFSSTKSRDRENLGDAVTAWLRSRNIEPESYRVLQSSDQAFHCLSIVIFYRTQTSSSK